MAGVLAGALLAGFFGVIGVLYQSSREHQHWLRATRLAAYASLLDAADSIRLLELSRAAALEMLTEDMIRKRP